MPENRWERPEVDLSALLSSKRDQISHIALRNTKDCQAKCNEKPCTFICPSQVYNWTGEEIDIDYDRCIECGACILACPNNNISWDYPRPGFGITYHY